MEPFLPATRQEMEARSWDQVDVVLVTGDAYVDHPSFGVAIIGRWLEANGFRVAILPQPAHDDPVSFRRFGRPRLFFGITAGNLDSIVANYTGNGRVRETDVYSPDGNPYIGNIREKRFRRRPDRATIRYSQLAREAYSHVPIVIGGIEASLRRFIHYDFQQEKIRASVLADSKADLLVYGMGERAVLEIARRIGSGRPLSGIAGTCERLTEREAEDAVLGTSPVVLPSFADIMAEPARFLDAELLVDAHARSLSQAPVLQRQQAVWVLQHPPSPPLSTGELDRIASLPYTRRPYPGAGDIPAWRSIRHSVTIVRGCSGNCSFCAIARHQGPVVTSRSPKSVLEEVRRVAGLGDFDGTITDLGGPTANLYGVTCGKKGPCDRHDCLYPRICPHLAVDEDAFLGLLEKASQVEGVRHLYISSGLRMELLLRTPRLLGRILERHVPGVMKIAPEHTEPEVLRLMHKTGSLVLARFLEEARALAARKGVRIAFSPYLIASHPGCTPAHMDALVGKFRLLDLEVRQFQDFTPTPGTLSTAMYVTGLDRDARTPIPVARTRSDRLLQRRIAEGLIPLKRPSRRPPTRGFRGPGPP